MTSTAPSTIDGRSDLSRAGSRATSTSPTEASMRTCASASMSAAGASVSGRQKDFSSAAAAGEKMGFGEDARALRVLDRVFAM